MRATAILNNLYDLGNFRPRVTNSDWIKNSWNQQSTWAVNFFRIKNLPSEIKKGFGGPSLKTPEKFLRPAKYFLNPFPID